MKAEGITRKGKRMTRDRYYEDYMVGEKIRSTGRQMTDADTRLLMGVISGSHPLHVDPEYCAGRPDVGRPILQGSLILGVVDAFFDQNVCPGEAVLSLPAGYEKIRFIQPIYVGDVLHGEFEVMGKETVETPGLPGEKAGKRYGKLTCGVTVYNQEGTAVVYALEHWLVERKKEG